MSKVRFQETIGIQSRVWRFLKMKILRPSMPGRQFGSPLIPTRERLDCSPKVRRKSIWIQRAFCSIPTASTILFSNNTLAICRGGKRRLKSLKGGTNDSGLLSPPGACASNCPKPSRLAVSTTCENREESRPARFRQKSSIQVPPELPPENA